MQDRLFDTYIVDQLNIKLDNSLLVELTKFLTPGLYGAYHFEKFPVYVYIRVCVCVFDVFLVEMSVWKFLTYLGILVIR